MSHQRSIDSTQAEISQVWRQFGFWVHDLHLAAQGYRFDHEGETVHGGIPDLLCQLGAVSVWVECKAPGGRWEASEIDFADEAERRGVPCVVNWGVEDAIRDATYWRDAALGIGARE